MDLIDDYNILGDFKKYIKDETLAVNIFNSYDNKKCILDFDDIVKVFSVSNVKANEFIDNFKSEIIRITNLNKKFNSEQKKEIKKTINKIYNEFNGNYDMINKAIENDDSESDSEDEIELEKNYMKPFCFYKINNEELNKDNLYILNKISKKIYNFKPPHDFYAKIDNSDNLILNENENPEEDISFYYQLRIENNIDKLYISSAGLSTLISESKKEYFDNTRSFSRFIGIPSQIGLCAFKAIKTEYRIRKELIDS